MEQQNIYKTIQTNYNQFINQGQNTTPQIQQDERMNNFHGYEINKYMQKNVKPIHMPRMV